MVDSRIIGILPYRTQVILAKIVTGFGSFLILNDAFGLLPKISLDSTLFLGIRWSHLLGVSLAYLFLLFWNKRFN